MIANFSISATIALNSSFPISFFPLLTLNDRLQRHSRVVSHSVPLEVGPSFIDSLGDGDHVGHVSGHVVPCQLSRPSSPSFNHDDAPLVEVDGANLLSGAGYYTR